jgi:mannose-6-phosphate isomerase-like protein (cupin superfamily)
MKFVFRKRAFHPGSGVGLHEQHEDEVYYALSGKGVMTVDGKDIEMTPARGAHAPGSSHSLKQTGPDDLVMLIAYEIK